MKYRSIFENLPNGVFLMGEAFEDCNERACELLACKRDDILGQSLFEFSPPKQPDGRDSAKIGQQYIEAAFSGIPQVFHWQIRRKDGVLILTEISIKSLEIDGRKSILATMCDITERKKVEVALEERNDFIEKVTDNLPIGFAVLPFEEGKVLYVNKRLEGILGWPRELIKDLEAFWEHSFPDPA